MLIANLAGDEKDMVEDVLFELELAAEHEAKVLYGQDLKDCV